MLYRKLGNTELEVSEISLGGWLTFGGHFDEQQGIKLIHHAFDNGINLFDTAEAYFDGQSEIMFGKALSQLPRHQFIIATKASGPWDHRLKPGGFSPTRLHDAVHASLKRLQLDYIDLYQLHWFDPDTPLEETMNTLHDLVQQGKVLHLGCSNFSAEQLRNALAICEAKHLQRFASIQPPYNMLYRTTEDTLLPLCTTEGISAIVYSPLAQGVLTGKYRPGTPYPPGSRATQEGTNIHMYLTRKILNAVVKLEKIASRKGKTIAQLALAWVLRRTEVSSAIIGASSSTQLEENINASGWKLAPQELQEIEHTIAGLSLE